MKKTKKTMKTKPLREWASRAKKKQSGGFAFLIAALIAAGISASTAAGISAVVTPVALGALGAVGAASANAIIKQAGGKKRQPVRRSRTKPLLLQTRLPQRRR